MKSLLYPIVLLAGLLLLLLDNGMAEAHAVVVGVNEGPVIKGAPSPQHTNAQTTIIEELKRNGVKVVRTGLYPGGGLLLDTVGQSADTAARLDSAGIKVVLLLNFIYRPDTPAYQTKSGPLSYADARLSKAYYQALIDALEARHVTLAGIELGNEFNGAAWNADFSKFTSEAVGSHRLLGLHDLSDTAEGQQIAKGFLRYLQVLAALKDVRDGSLLNKHTPLISGGTAGWDLPDNTSYPSKMLPYDIVSPSATLAFLRTHGLDNLVDGYGVVGTIERKTGLRIPVRQVKDTGSAGECLPGGE